MSLFAENRQECSKTKLCRLAVWSILVRQNIHFWIESAGKTNSFPMTSSRGLFSRSFLFFSPVSYMGSKLFFISRSVRLCRLVRPGLCESHNGSRSHTFFVHLPFQRAHKMLSHTANAARKSPNHLLVLNKYISRLHYHSLKSKHPNKTFLPVE